MSITNASPLNESRAGVGRVGLRGASSLGGAWGSFWRSRLLVWLAGSGPFLALGSSGAERSFDPARMSTSLGQLGNTLAAPAVRWDSIWYLDVAQHGYHAARDAAFYPLYPMLVRAGGWVTGSLVLAGVAISLVATFVALTLMHRLAERELGAGPARGAVDLLAFGPVAIFLSAVYTEGLFLALSVGTLYAARRGRWAMAGAVGALAAMTRVTGVLLVVPVVILYLYGPRDDRAPDIESGRHRPRYRLDLQALWACLIPAGAAAFAGYLALRGFGALGALHAERHYWGRETVGPLVALPRAVAAAIAQLTGTASGISPQYEAQAVQQLVFLLLAGGALVLVLRRLPVAYGAYCAVGLLSAVSTTAGGTALVSFDRYAGVLFPLYMGAGAWAAERRLVRPIVIGSGLVLAYFSLRFATWRWVA
jgi:hypothetical protein